MTKQTDSKVKELINEYIQCFKNKYQREPIINWGKSGKISQQLWLWALNNNIQEFQIYNALINYFTSDDEFLINAGHPFELFYTKINTFLQAPKPSKEAEIITKAREIFLNTQSENVSRETIQEFSDNELQAKFGEIYTRDEVGCMAFCKGHRFLQATLDPKEGSRLYTSWKRSGRMAKQYFGEELLLKCWNTKEPEKPVKPSVNEQINMAFKLEKA